MTQACFDTSTTATQRVASALEGAASPAAQHVFTQRYADADLSTVARNQVLDAIEDKEYLHGGVVYVAPAGYHLSIETERSFSLSREEPRHFSRPSIDILFESAADAYGTGLLAILLTGANHDGARGLAHVKQQGGTTVVQDPTEARVAVMPRAALALHTPDHILSLSQIGSLLASLEYSPC
mgnify:CR=1 FL=1